MAYSLRSRNNASIRGSTLYLTDSHDNLPSDRLERMYEPTDGSSSERISDLVVDEETLHTSSHDGVPSRILASPEAFHDYSEDGSDAELQDNFSGVQPRTSQRPQLLLSLPNIRQRGNHRRTRDWEMSQTEPDLRRITDDRRSFGEGLGSLLTRRTDITLNSELIENNTDSLSQLYLDTLSVLEQIWLWLRIVSYLLAIVGIELLVFGAMYVISDFT